MGYIWLRFQNFAFSLAAVIALIHDVLIMVGMLALSKYFVDAVPGVAQFLLVDSFQIGLSVLAAILTLIGYSLNDTIVTFDRIREVRGKSPKLTGNMINLSINQTLSRTILTFLCTFIVTVILYIYGGPGIHAFLLVGMIAGTYSSIYIAAPILLWIAGDAEA
jgi:SecD/SecF fusion protein